MTSLLTSLSSTSLTASSRLFRPGFSPHDCERFKAPWISPSPSYKSHRRPLSFPFSPSSYCASRPKKLLAGVHRSAAVLSHFRRKQCVPEPDFVPILLDVTSRTLLTACSIFFSQPDRRVNGRPDGHHLPQPLRPCSAADTRRDRACRALHRPRGVVPRVVDDCTVSGKHQGDQRIHARAIRRRLPCLR